MKQSMNWGARRIVFKGAGGMSDASMIAGMMWRLSAETAAAMRSVAVVEPKRALSAMMKAMVSVDATVATDVMSGSVADAVRAASHFVAEVFAANARWRARSVALTIWRAVLWSPIAKRAAASSVTMEEGRMWMRATQSERSAALSARLMMFERMRTGASGKCSTMALRRGALRVWTAMRVRGIAREADLLKALTRYGKRGEAHSAIAAFIVAFLSGDKTDIYRTLNSLRSC